jgi:hypothetical protein
MTEPAILAIIAAGLYGLGCKFFGYVFPFDEYNLYAGIGNRDKSAAPVFYADGELAKPWEFHQYCGFESAEFLPSHVPTGLSWRAHETGRWIREHSWQGEPGPVEAQYGFIQYSLDEHGRVHEEVLIVCRGTAWKL